MYSIIDVRKLDGEAGEASRIGGAHGAFAVAATQALTTPRIQTVDAADPASLHPPMSKRTTTMSSEQWRAARRIQNAVGVVPVPSTAGAERVAALRVELYQGRAGCAEKRRPLVCLLGYGRASGAIRVIEIDGWFLLTTHSELVAAQCWRTACSACSACCVCRHVMVLMDTRNLKPSPLVCHSPKPFLCPGMPQPA